MCWGWKLKLGLFYLTGSFSHYIAELFQKLKSYQQFSFYEKKKQIPHSVEQGTIFHNPQQLVGHGHVVSYRFLAIVEESVRGPDFTGHQVVEREDVHWSMELESLILPTLSEKDIHSVLLKGEEQW